MQTPITPPVSEMAAMTAVEGPPVSFVRVFAVVPVVPAFAIESVPAAGEQVEPRVQVAPPTVTEGFTNSAFVIEALGNVCVAVQVFAWPNASEATALPDVGEIVNVPSLFDTVVTPEAE